MSCAFCVFNGRKSCDPDPLPQGCCGNFRTDWENEDDNGGLPDIEDYEDEDVFETLGNAFKPE